MPVEEKAYSVVAEAKTIMDSLKERYPSVLWTVDPSKVVVLGVTNKEPPEPKPGKLKTNAKIRKINGSIAALLEYYKVPIKYVIELYYSDWQGWSNARRQWILLHELSHIPALDEGGLIKHDVQDFSFILDAVGVDWTNSSILPDLLDGEPVKFNEALVTRLHMQPEYEEAGVGAEAEL